MESTADQMKERTEPAMWKQDSRKHPIGNGKNKKYFK